jgi:predicted RNA-binding Zn-ribbon protein involved in translation (DUF1610 family)
MPSPRRRERVAGRLRFQRVVGGPLDGGRATRRAERFRFLDTQGRTFARAGEGRTLYENIGGQWVHPGHGARQCTGCEAILSPEPGTGDALAHCPLCGATQAVRPVRGA